MQFGQGQHGIQGLGQGQKELPNIGQQGQQGLQGLGQQGQQSFQGLGQQGQQSFDQSLQGYDQNQQQGPQGLGQQSLQGLGQQGQQSQSGSQYAQSQLQSQQFQGQGQQPGQQQYGAQQFAGQQPTGQQYAQAPQQYAQGPQQYAQGPQAYQQPAQEYAAAAAPTSEHTPSTMQQQQQQQQQQYTQQQHQARYAQSGYGQAEEVSSQTEAMRSATPAAAPAAQYAQSPSRDEPADRTLDSMRNAYPASQTTPSKSSRMDPSEISRVSRIYYVELLQFFRSQTTKISLLTNSRSNAREKLTRLSKQQFAELSTDVHDELKRRQANAEGDQSTPYLPGRDDFHPKRNQARQKLATLPKNRFRDLASDVFFELERRFPEFPAELRPEPLESIMAPKEGANERESQAEAPAPALNTVPSATAPPEQQTSTAQSFVPTRSTAVEENVNLPYTIPQEARQETHDAAPSRDAAQDAAQNEVVEARAAALQARNADEMQELRSMYEDRIHTLQQHVERLENDLGAASRARDEYRGAYDEQQAQAKTLEGHVRQLEQMLDGHRSQITELRAAHEERQTELGEKHRALESATSELTRHRTDLDALRSEYNTLHAAHANASREAAAVDEAGWKREIERMQRDTQQQQQFVQELRMEVASLLEELRRLSARNDAMTADKESDVAIIRDLHAQMSNYKRQYENATGELRALKATTQLWSQPLRSEEWMHLAENGAIADTNLTSFQSSIDELLASSRSSTPSNVLVSMKSVVLSTTLITDDVAKYEGMPELGPQLSRQQHEDLQTLKVSMSEALANLMNACRNHASSQGLAPVSLVDAATTHVAMAVVEMIKLVKLRKVNQPRALEPEATEEAQDAPPSSSGLKPLHISQRSALASPPNSAGIARTRRAPSQGSLRNLAYNAESRDVPPVQIPERDADDLERPRTASAGKYSPVRYAQRDRPDAPSGLRGLALRSDRDEVSPTATGPEISSPLASQSSAPADWKMPAAAGAAGVGAGLAAFSGPSAPNASEPAPSARDVPQAPQDLYAQAPQSVPSTGTSPAVGHESSPLPNAQSASPLNAAAPQPAQGPSPVVGANASPFPNAQDTSPHFGANVSPFPNAQGASPHGPGLPQASPQVNVTEPRELDSTLPPQPAQPAEEPSQRQSLGQMAFGAAGVSAAFGALGAAGASGATTVAPEPRSLAEIPIPEENAEAYSERASEVADAPALNRASSAASHSTLGPSPAAAYAPQGASPVPSAVAPSPAPSSQTFPNELSAPVPDASSGAFAADAASTRAPDVSPRSVDADAAALADYTAPRTAAPHEYTAPRPAEDLAAVEEVDDSENWAELRNYIEVQTEAIVHSIQSLLSALREGVQGPQLNENLTQITTIVFSIVAISRDHLPQSTSPRHAPIAAEAERIFAELTENCDRLSDMQTDTSFDRTTKSVMASASYGVAKGLKALNELLNDADEAALQP